MEKRQYTSPLTEVMSIETVLMQVVGPASMPDDKFKGGAPERRVEVF